MDRRTETAAERRHREAVEHRDWVEVDAESTEDDWAEAQEAVAAAWRAVEAERAERAGR